MIESASIALSNALQEELDLLGTEHLLWSYYASCKEAVDALILETSDPLDCDAFVVWKSLEGDRRIDQDILLSFREEHARAIGQASGLITSIFLSLKDALNETEKEMYNEHRD